MYEGTRFKDGRQPVRLGGPYGNVQETVGGRAASIDDRMGLHEQRLQRMDAG